MYWQRLHAAAKSAFLAFREWRTRRLSPVKAQLSMFALREINSWSTWVETPPPQRLRNWTDAFLSHSAALYDFEQYDRGQFLTDIERERTGNINQKQFVSLLANKVGLYKAMQPFDDHLPETYGVITDGHFHPIRTVEVVPDKLGGATAASDAVEWVLDSLEERDSLVLKPVHGAGGDGVKLCSSQGDSFLINGESMGLAAFQQEIASLENYLAMEQVQQATYADELFLDATNTVRVLTMWDSEYGEPFCPVAVQRVGTEASAPVDNFDRHGISAIVDRETGELGRGVQLREDGQVAWHDTHPSTSTSIAGTRIPG